MTSLDHAINNDLLIVSKSLVPYLDVSRQKPIAILIKVIELLYTINLYSNPDAVLELSHAQEPGWEKDFLKDVKNNLDNDKAYLIDIILKLTEAKDLLVNPDFNLMQLFTTNSAPTTAQVTAPVTTQQETTTTLPIEQLIGTLSSLFDTNGTQLLNALAALLKPNTSTTATQNQC